MEPENIQEQLGRLESRTGRLSPLQKVLLGTDGSVTTLLEVITGHAIGISTERQEIVPADEQMAGSLKIRPGEEVNTRTVTIRDEETGSPLVHALSLTPLSRLEPGFRSDLMSADIPIGKILRTHHIEARREIHRIGAVHADAAMSALFGIYPRELLFERTYSIIHRGKPLIRIAERFPKCSFTSAERIIVEAPSRIHIALIDLHGGLGRVDGGIGFALEAPSTVLEVVPSEKLEVAGGTPDQERRVRAAAEAVLREPGSIHGARITLHAAPAAHAGLGSGTALALSTASALHTLAGDTVPVPGLAAEVGRGGTSGIGTAVFEYGGFIVDGGHSFGTTAQKSAFTPSSASPDVRPPPVIARHPFPADWKVLLVSPHVVPGVSGAGEKDIFRNHCPIPAGEVREICHEVVMRLLPGIAGHDLDLFGSSINRLQEIGFKKIELGLQPPLIPGLLAAMRSAGAACAGLSSFGPTVYAITDTGAGAIESAVHEVLGEHGGDVWITRGRNRGAALRRAEGI